VTIEADLGHALIAQKVIEHAGMSHKAGRGLGDPRRPKKGDPMVGAWLGNVAINSYNLVKVWVPRGGCNELVYGFNVLWVIDHYKPSYSSGASPCRVISCKILFLSWVSMAMGI
jgi:hypothetical protein